MYFYVRDEVKLWIFNKLFTAKHIIYCSDFIINLTLSGRSYRSMRIKEIIV